MPDDRLPELFREIALADVKIPAVSQVLARGRRRRRRRLARLGTSACALAILVTVGTSPSQVSELTVMPVRAVHGLLAPQSAPHVMRHRPGPNHLPAGPPAQPGSGRRPASAPPPPGNGQLVLGLAADDRFVITRVGPPTAPVPVRRLRAIPAGPSLLVTNPAGGWVVTYSAGQGTSHGSWPTRLALVTTTGQSEPFGPVFAYSTVTSAAVSPDGSRVAVALCRPLGGPASIEVLPMPGHAGEGRARTIPLAEARFADGLSWAPDGRTLRYHARGQAGTGITGDPRTPATAGPGSIAARTSGWPPWDAGPCPSS